MSIFTLYLLSILDGINFAFVLFTVMSLISTIVGACVYMTNATLKSYVEDANMGKRIAKTASIWLIVFLTASVLTPTTKQGMLITGGYYVTNLDNIDKLPANTVEAANAFLEQYTKELKDVEGK